MTASFGLIDVRQNHRFDTEALEAFLARDLEGYSNGLRVQQFAGGQSNPTFRITDGSGAHYVLRKKPPGELLPSAHQIEREYRICTALAETDVPVPRMLLLCQDPQVVGTPFYVMEYVHGHVFADPGLPQLAPEQRRQVNLQMIRVLAALHQVDYAALGLGDFGRPGNYFARQVNRWTKQYRAAQTDRIDSMECLIDWLAAHLPEDETTTVVHGDYQLYNLLFDPRQLSCVAVLDWELSTLGHPLADLAYNCMRYHAVESAEMLRATAGIPSEEELVEAYCQLTGRRQPANWPFYLAFAFFRMASIVQGVYARGLQGNASSASALDMRDRIRTSADTGWQLACRSAN